MKASENAQQVNTPVAKFKDLSSIPRMEKGKN